MANWEFNVLDRMTDPLKKMGSSLEDFDKTLDEAEKKLHDMEKAAKLEAPAKSTDPVKQAIGYQRMFVEQLKESKRTQDATIEKGGFFKRMFGSEGFFAAEQIERVVEYGRAIAELGVEFVKFGTEASDFKEDSIETLSVMLDSKEAAEKEFEVIGRMAKNSAMTKAEVMTQYTELFSFTQKYGAEATENVIAAGSDIGRLLNKGAQDAFLGVMKNIEAMGGLNERMVKQLKEVGVATPDKLYTALAERLHTTTKGAQALLKAGQISQEQSIDTLLDLVQKNINKGEKLGTYSVKMSAEDAGDAVKNLGDAWKDLFSDVDTAPIAAGINSLIKAMDPASESGKKMRDLLNRAFDDIGKAASYAADHMEEWVGTADSVLTKIEKITKFIEDNPTIAKMLLGAAVGGAVGGVPGALIGATGALVYTASKEVGEGFAFDSNDAAMNAEARRRRSEADLLEWQKTHFRADREDPDVKAAADATADGFMLEMSKKFEDGIPKIAKEKIVEGIKKGVDAHSPSREMMKIGRYSADGYILGWNQGFDTFSTSAPSALIDDARAAIGREFTSQSSYQAPVVTGPAGNSFTPGGLPPISVSIQNSFAGGAPTDSASQLSFEESMQNSVQTGIMKAFENLNYQ